MSLREAIQAEILADPGWDYGWSDEEELLDAIMELIDRERPAAREPAPEVTPPAFDVVTNEVPAYRDKFSQRLELEEKTAVEATPASVMAGAEMDEEKSP